MWRRERGSARLPDVAADASLVIHPPTKTRLSRLLVCLTFRYFCLRVSRHGSLLEKFFPASHDVRLWLGWTSPDQRATMSFIEMRKRTNSPWNSSMREKIVHGNDEMKQRNYYAPFSHRSYDREMVSVRERFNLPQNRRTKGSDPAPHEKSSQSDRLRSKRSSIQRNTIHQMLSYEWDLYKFHTRTRPRHESHTIK